MESMTQIKLAEQPNIMALLQTLEDNRLNKEKQEVGALVSCLDSMEEQYGKTEVEALLKGRGRQIRISMTYYPDINEYMGKKTPQIVVTHYR